MKKTLITLCLAALATTGIHAQDQQLKSAEDLAIEMVNKMETQLKLEPHQTFYVDSILCHDYRCWMDEIDKYRMSGVQESSIYLTIKDKWQAQIDSSLVKVLTPDQYIEYLKMTGKYKKPKKDKKTGKN